MGGLLILISSFGYQRLCCLLLVAACGPSLTACTLPYEQLTLPSPVIGSNSPERGTVGTRPPGLPLSGPGAVATTEPRVYTGSGEFASNKELLPSATSAETKDGISLNLVGASVAEVAKTVLGDVLGVNYSVSDKVKANITLHTVQPVSKAGLVEILDAVLRAEGAALIVDAGVYKILPSSDVAAHGAPLRPRKASGPAGAGVVTEVIQLNYVSAPEMERVLKSAAPQAGILRVDTARNLLMLSGTRAELAALIEMVGVFDVDWMRGMSFAIFPVETADPEAIAQELDVIFANDKESPTKGIVRFVPNRRLKSVLVISSRPEFMKKAWSWLTRIDMHSRATEKRVNVYHVQHRPAVELAALLQRVYRGGAGSTLSRLSTQTAATAGVEGSRGAAEAAGAAGLAIPAIQPPAAPTFGATPSDASRTTGEPAPSGEQPAIGAAAGSGLPPDDRAAGISVIADETNNSLVITATPAEYNRLREILRSVDVAANKVLLEATIAEVTLNDELKFGVRWFLKDGSHQFSLTDAIVGSVAPAASGFNYFLNIRNVQVVLNALSTVTDVNVVSSPTLMVLENKRAVLQVGDEVPIVTQQAQGVQVAGAPIVNSVSFRSTGVILGITPRASDDGNLLLDIEQEVSDAVRTTSSDINAPTIQQRRVKTTVSVRNGESIVLAGFMQDKATRARDQMPLLGDVPVVGNLFKSKDNTIARTELIIAITPHLVKDGRQIEGITNEYRDRLNFSTRPQRSGPPDFREQADRVLVR